MALYCNTNSQHCTECIHFNNETHEDCFDGDYHMWTEVSCEMGHEIDDGGYSFIPFDEPCEDYKVEE